MKAIKKTDLVLISILTCFLAFILPFFFKTCEDTFLSVVSVSLTAVGTVATLWTLVIAVYLYDRFGLEAKFIERKTDKVLELIDLLKGRTIVVKSDGFNYFIRPSRKQLQLFKSIKHYQIDKGKKILISFMDYDIFTREIIAITRSYWLPDEIKTKMEFLRSFGVNNFTESSFDNYVRFDFRTGTTDNNWVVPFPEITFENFNDSLNELILTIENWLSKHSGIELNLKLEEPNQVITDQPDTGRE